MDKAKRKKRIKTDKSKAPKGKREGTVSRGAEAAVGEGVCLQEQPKGRHLMGARRCHRESAWVRGINYLF